MAKATWEQISVDLGGNSKGSAKQNQTSGMWYCSELTTVGKNLDDVIKDIDKGIKKMNEVLLKRNKIKLVPDKDKDVKKKEEKK